MRHHGWISRAALNFIAHRPLRHLFGSISYFQTDGARLLDAWVFAFWALMLISVAFAVWRLRGRFVKPRNEYRLWLVLIVLVFGGTALWYSLISEPDTDTNFWALAPVVAKLPAPVYTDRYTAFDLRYLSAYQDRNVQSGRYLRDDYVRPLLRRSRGCFLLSEPQLERERASHLAKGSTALIFAVLHHPPAGWRVIKRVTATENPFASIVILCARGSVR